jgi:hypothetical protein
MPDKPLYKLRTFSSRTTRDNGRRVLAFFDSGHERMTKTIRDVMIPLLRTADDQVTFQQQADIHLSIDDIRSVVFQHIPSPPDTFEDAPPTRQEPEDNLSRSSSTTYSTSCQSDQ